MYAVKRLMMLSCTQKQFHNRTTTFIVFALSFCVAMQLLGVPATLWTPGAILDTFGASVDEGFSILPTNLPVVQMVFLTLLVTFQRTSHVPILSRSLFHPPVAREPIHL